MINIKENLPKTNTLSFILGTVSFITIWYMLYQEDLISSCFAILITYNCVNNIRHNKTDNKLKQLEEEVKALKGDANERS